MYDIIFLLISESQINFKVVQILMLPSVGQGNNKLSLICVRVVTVQDSQSGKSFSTILNLAKKCSEITNKMFKRTKHP